jgi:hypothetical protein
MPSLSTLGGAKRSRGVNDELLAKLEGIWQSQPNFQEICPAVH